MITENPLRVLSRKVISVQSSVNRDQLVWETDGSVIGLRDMSQDINRVEPREQNSRPVWMGVFCFGR